MKITARREGERDWVIRIDRDWYGYYPSLTDLALYSLIETMFAKRIQESLHKAIE